MSVCMCVWGGGEGGWGNNVCSMEGGKPFSGGEGTFVGGGNF